MKCDVYFRKELADHVPSRSIGRPVTHIVMLPNYQEDEATLREPHEILVPSPPAVRRVFIVLAMEASTLFVFTVLRTAVNSDFVCSST